MLFVCYCYPRDEKCWHLWNLISIYHSIQNLQNSKGWYWTAFVFLGMFQTFGNIFPLSHPLLKIYHPRWRYKLSDISKIISDFEEKTMQYRMLADVGVDLLYFLFTDTFTSDFTFTYNLTFNFHKILKRWCSMVLIFWTSGVLTITATDRFIFTSFFTLPRLSSDSIWKCLMVLIFWTSGVLTVSTTDHFTRIQFLWSKYKNERNIENISS